MLTIGIILLELLEARKTAQHPRLLYHLRSHHLPLLLLAHDELQSLVESSLLHMPLQPRLAPFLREACTVSMPAVGLLQEDGGGSQPVLLPAAAADKQLGRAEDAYTSCHAPRQPTLL